MSIFSARQSKHPLNYLLPSNGELPPFEKGGFWGRILNYATKFAGWQCPSYGLAHDSPYLGDLPQGSSAYVEGSIPVRVLFQSASGALEQPVMVTATLSQSPAPPAQLGRVGFVHLDHLDASPVGLVCDVFSEYPEGPRVQLSVEFPAFTVAPDALRVADRDESIQSLRLVNNRFGDFVQLVINDATLLGTDSLYYLQQLLLSKSSPQVEVVSPYSPQLPPVEVGLARLGVHRTRRVSDSHVYGKNRGVGCFDFDLTFDGEVQKVFSAPPEQLRLADFEVFGDFAVRFDSDPYSTTAELDWDANPIAGELGVSMLDPDEVFSDGERVFSFGFDALVESSSLLFICRVEFNAGIPPQEPLKPIVLVVENLALDVRQPHDLCPDDFLHLHHSHHFSVSRL